jgi:hypothetical protein
MRRSSPLALHALGLLMTGLCLHCSMEDKDDLASGAPSGVGASGPAQGGSFGTGASGPSAGTAPAAGGSDEGPIVVPPEKELEQSFLAPVVNGRYVFSANPKSGRVAVIDAESYKVRLFNAGFGPKYLAALPGSRGAIVINELSHDTTLFRLSGDDVSVSDTSLPVHQDANAWSVSPDGRFALAWTRTELEQAPDPTAGSQTVTLLDLERSRATQLTVGFHPTRALISDDSTRAFVVSDDGVSVIALGDEPEVTLLAPVSEDPLEEAGTRDVSITPDGSFAVVRIEGSRELRLVDLSRDDALVSFDLGAPVADVDLSRDGKLAVAALPGIGEVVLVPMPPAADQSNFERVKIPREITSSVALSDDSEVALLYQNGADNSHLTVLDLRDGKGRALRTVDLKGPISAVFAAPGAASAIAFQKPISGSKRLGLWSGVPTLASRSAKIVGTDAVPTALAFDDVGDYALVTIGGEKSQTHGVYRVVLSTMQEDFVELASPPATAATGIVVEAGRGFVAQTHPEGRITFVDLKTAQAHTITGFELAARILQ